MEKQVDLSVLVKSWEHPYVCRQDISRFTGGMVKPATIANYDAAGTGPVGRIRVGRQVAYPAAEVVTWLESRAELLD